MSTGLPTLILLPGMDGTGELFRPLLDVIPHHLPRRVVSYPEDQPLSYDELLRFVGRSLAPEGDVVLLAESFSGPVAVRYAAAHPDAVRAVVLCASFVRAPVPRWVRFLVTPLLFHVPLPSFAVRRLMAGRDAPDALVAAVKAAVLRVRPGVLARRVREVFDVDCADALARCPAPVLYLAGGDDALVGPRGVEAVRVACPGMTVRTIEGPHLLLQARPSDCWREIARFLEATRGGVPPDLTS